MKTNAVIIGPLSECVKIYQLRISGFGLRILNGKTRAAGGAANYFSRMKLTNLYHEDNNRGEGK
jgi:hypothetical protein